MHSYLLLLTFPCVANKANKDVHIPHIPSFFYLQNYNTYKLYVEPVKRSEQKRSR